MLNNDWIVANIQNPDYTTGMFSKAGLDTENTQMLSEDSYLKSNFIIKNPYFADKNGNFDKDKFHDFYKDAATGWKQIQTKKNLEHVYDFFDPEAPEGAKKINPLTGDTKDLQTSASKPFGDFLKIVPYNDKVGTIGVGGFNSIEAPTKSAREEAIQGVNNSIGAVRTRVETLENAGYQNAVQVGTAIDNKINELNLPGTYEVKGAAAQALVDAKSYVDGEISRRVVALTNDEIMSILGKQFKGREKKSPSPIFFERREDLGMANDENLKQIKVLTEDGLRVLLEQLGLEDYVTNSNLIGIINAIDEVKADKSQLPTKVSQLSNDVGYLTEVINISGNARSADRLNSYGGSGIHPVYFNKEGIPVECDYSIEYANEGDINSLFSML